MLELVHLQKLHLQEFRSYQSPISQQIIGNTVLNSSIADQ